MNQSVCKAYFEGFKKPTNIASMIEVREIKTEADMLKAFEIRRLVFVIEQQVDPKEEYDEHEIACTHFLAMKDRIPCGTARIRKTENGFKLERFAVLKNYRGYGIGAALVNACLAHEWLATSETYVYMHAQEHALGFYAKFGFEPKGERFYECEMPHFTMFKTT
jgi:predicted GNAT family N-acyltransferase